MYQLQVEKAEHDDVESWMNELMKEWTNESEDD